MAKMTVEKEKPEAKVQDLLEIIKQAARSHAWMLETMVRKSDEVNVGNYSDELKHAILVQELLETENG